MLLKSMKVRLERGAIMLNEKGLIGALVTIVVVIILVVGAAAGTYWWQSQQSQEERERVERRIERLTKSFDELKERVSKPVEKVEDVVKGAVVSPRGTIKVTEPKPGATISSPVKIAGEAQVFEANVRLRVKDATGKVLGNGFTTATQGAPEFGDFSAEFSFKQPAETQVGTVEVFEESAKDGSVADWVVIPVLIEKSE
jgi:type II secretory pathway pseudopilin PulG